MEERIDAVLPLTASDLERAQILFRSLDAFFEPLARCFVVVPDDDVAVVRSKVPAGPYEVVRESDLIPEIGYFWRTTRLRAKLHLVGPPIHGWFVQQLVKLAVADRIGTPFYLTLDADVICARPTTYADLVVDGRAVVQTAEPNHPEWNDDAERVLGVPRIGRQFAVTPAVLSRDVVLALAEHVENRVDPRLRKLAARLPDGRLRELAASWRSFLLRSLPWTEYALYHTFLQRTGRLDDYHVLRGPDAIYARAVWMEDEFDDWDAAWAFRPSSPWCFTVVQSATRIPPDRVWAAVRPYLERRAAA